MSRHEDLVVPVTGFRILFFTFQALISLGPKISFYFVITWLKFLYERARFRRVFLSTSQIFTSPTQVVTCPADNDLERTKLSCTFYRWDEFKLITAHQSESDWFDGEKTEHPSEVTGRPVLVSVGREAVVCSQHSCPVWRVCFLIISTRGWESFEGGYSWETCLDSWLSVYQCWDALSWLKTLWFACALTASIPTNCTPPSQGLCHRSKFIQWHVLDTATTIHLTLCLGL